MSRVRPGRRRAQHMVFWATVMVAVFGWAISGWAIRGNPDGWVFLCAATLIVGAAAVVLFDVAAHLYPPGRESKVALKLVRAEQTLDEALTAMHEHRTVGRAMERVEGLAYRVVRDPLATPSQRSRAELLLWDVRHYRRST